MSFMFKLSYNSNGLRCMDPIQAINEVAKAGYDGIELSFHPAHINPLEIDYALLDRVKDALNTNHLVLASIASGCADLLSDEPYEPSLISPDQEGRKRRIDMMKNSITIAKYLNCPILSFASGFRKNEMSEEEANKILVDGIQELLRESGDLILAIEPEPDMFIGTSSSAIKLIDEIQNEYLKLNLDIGHVNCCEEDYLKKIDKALDYTVHCHIEDIKNRIHSHLIPGDGDIEFDRIWDILKKHSYPYFISVELYNHSDIWQTALEESISYLRNLK